LQLNTANEFNTIPNNPNNFQGHDTQLSKQKASYSDVNFLYLFIANPGNGGPQALNGYVVGAYSTEYIDNNSNSWYDAYNDLSVQTPAPTSIPMNTAAPTLQPTQSPTTTTIPSSSNSQTEMTSSAIVLLVLFLLALAGLVLLGIIIVKERNQREVEGSEPGTLAYAMNNPIQLNSNEANGRNPTFSSYSDQNL